MVTENLSNTSNRDKNLFFLNSNMFILHINYFGHLKNSYGKATTNNNGYGHYL